MAADWKTELKPLALIAAVFAAAYVLPVDLPRFQNGMMEGFHLVKWYAREHMALCVVPALFIAGAIGVFVSQASVMRYLGAGAKRWVAYGVASVSGSVLAVCSCTVLPLFAGIYKRGAGLGPAAAFLYAGPAINVLAIILSARILGLELGVARVVGAVGFSILLGLLMHLFFRKEEAQRTEAALAEPEAPEGRPLHQTLSFFGAMIAVLIFANWAPSKNAVGWWEAIFQAKWYLTSAFGLLFALVLVRWYGLALWKLALLGGGVLALALTRPEVPDLAFSLSTLGLGFIASRSQGEVGEWFDQTWGFAKQIVPLLLGGVFVAGICLGRPGQEGLIPNAWIAHLVGGNSLAANFISALSGAFMYFATLTEIPILQGLMGSGMGKGPALALLLAGPALSLPSMLVLNSILGPRKTAVFVALVVILATLTGWLFGLLFA